MLMGHKESNQTKSLANEIAKPRPDMNIKVATFTVSEKSTKFLIVKLYDYSSV